MLKKEWYKSMSVWACGLGSIAFIMVLARVVWLAQTMTELMENLNVLFVALVGFLSNAIGLYGRLTATKEIGNPDENQAE